MLAIQKIDSINTDVIKNKFYTQDYNKGEDQSNNSLQNLGSNNTYDQNYNKNKYTFDQMAENDNKSQKVCNNTKIYYKIDYSSNQLKSRLKNTQKSPQKNPNYNKKFWDKFWKYSKITAIFSIFGSVVTIIGAPMLLWIIKTFAFLPTNSFLYDPQNFDMIIVFTTITSLSLIFQSLSEIFNRYFIASQKILAPVISSIAGNLLALEIAFLYSDSWGSGWAVAWGFVFNSFLLCCISGILVYRDWQNERWL
jgi:hypothetical protein